MLAVSKFSLVSQPLLNMTQIAFIDPYFSSGVHLAVSGGLAAAATICAALKGECTEEEASSWYRGRVEGSYGR